MALKIIPEKRIRTCDGCNREISNDVDLTVQLRQLSRDFQGAACAAISTNLDFCAVCGQKVVDFINEMKGSGE